MFAQDQNGYPYSPAWYTLNLRTQFKFSDTLSFIGSIEKTKVDYLKRKLRLNKNDNSTLLKTPIFILGMPRSGTTLTEQIIASHSKVYGGGELTLVEESLIELDWKKNIVDKKFIKNFRELYSEKLCSIKTSKTLISDKMPGNFLWIGIILASMPEVKIIHTKRNTQATMWSIFKSYFTSDGNGYAYNLDDIYFLNKKLVQLGYYLIVLYNQQLLTFYYQGQTKHHLYHLL